MTRITYYCSNGRRHAFWSMFADGSGTVMDIGPCEGESCTAPHDSVCHCDTGSCLRGRRVTLDRWQGRVVTRETESGTGKRKSATVITIDLGPLHEQWHRLAVEAEAADHATSGWPADWHDRREDYGVGLIEKIEWAPDHPGWAGKRVITRL